MQVQIIWDLEDDPEGNLQHIAEHGITAEEAEQVLVENLDEATFSRSSEQPMIFGWTRTGKYIAVVFQQVEQDPPIVYPITAYEAPPPRRRRRKR